MDMVIRNGRIVDGTGAPAYHADVGVSKGRIVEIGRVTARGKKEIDAEGLMVTPGFIDGHTHMDAQMNWDPSGSCSSWHGVTSVVMGNCGFTLAPSHEAARHLITGNLERAEDISASAMQAGIKWGWETFPEYLEVLEKMPKGVNAAVYFGHSALRTWLMGEEAFERESTAAEIEKMENCVREALDAGAIGFSTSRNKGHEATGERPVASRHASWEEVRRLVMVMRDAQCGVFEISKENAANSADPEERRECLDRMRSLAVESRVPMTFGLTAMRGWEDHLALLDETARQGGRMYGQSHSRGMNVLLSFRTQMPFDALPLWSTVRQRPLDEQRHLLSDPDLRRRLVEEAHNGKYPRSVGNETRKPDWTEFRIRTGPYPPYPLLADVAKAENVDPVELIITLAVESNFEQFFIQAAVPGQYEDQANIPHILKHPRTVMTFSDSGAHVSQIADFSIQTHLLAYWSRMRELFTPEEAVRMLTQVPANVWQLTDRGSIKQGMAADLNVIDFDRLEPGELEVRADIPTGAKRLVQRGTGYVATIVGGEIVRKDGTDTGALPGRLLRNSRASARSSG